MSQVFPTEYKEIADGMGISVWQRFTLEEASLFLRCNVSVVEKNAANGDLGYIHVPRAEKQIFGYQLIEYLLENTEERKVQPTRRADQPERILRIPEVVEITGLSRTTIWRVERKGEFPARVQLSENSVGWRESEVKEWIRTQI